MGFQGWVSQAAGEKLLAMAGRHVEELLAASEKREFRPIDLGMTLKMRVESKMRPLNSRNVAAVIPGSDPKLKDEVVIYSAHWDHFGIGEAVNGDNIYNGAID